MDSKATTSAFGRYARSGAAIGGILATLTAATLFLAPAHTSTEPWPDRLGGTAPTDATLQQRIAAQDSIIAMTESMKRKLQEPIAIWGSERSALPYNYRAIENYRQRIAILDRDLDTARHVRAALVAALPRAPDASSGAHRQGGP